MLRAEKQCFDQQVPFSDIAYFEAEQRFFDLWMNPVSHAKELKLMNHMRDKVPWHRDCHVYITDEARDAECNEHADLARARDRAKRNPQDPRTFQIDNTRSVRSGNDLPAVDDVIAVVDNHSSVYSKFSTNVCSADELQLATTATALPASSSTLDVLGLIHERT